MEDSWGTTLVFLKGTKPGVGISGWMSGPLRPCLDWEPDFPDPKLSGTDFSSSDFNGTDSSGPDLSGYTSKLGSYSFKS
jgi:hypothetical protein